MEREALVQVLAVVILVNVAAIALALGGRRRRKSSAMTSATTSRPASRDAAVGVLASARASGRWSDLADEAAAAGRRHGRDAAVVVFELVGFERLTGDLGSAASGHLDRSMTMVLAGAARDVDRVGTNRRGRYRVLLGEGGERAAVAYVARIARAIGPRLAASPVPLRLDAAWASMSGGIGLQAAIHLAEDRLVEATADRRGATPSTRRLAVAQRHPEPATG